MPKQTVKIDLHVHSKHSTRPSQWILQKIGCPESFTEPMALYRHAKDRGMDMVTITDHNTIAGSLEIAHLRDTFIGEEITTYFPEDRCKAHVLALDITEAHHDDFQKIRDNIFDLVSYLRENKIFHILAHPLFGVNDRLTVDHFEQFLLLFRNFELNGTRDDMQNRLLASMLRSLTPDVIDDLSNRHDLAPVMAEPWRKNLSGGSDDHSSLNIARMYTAVEMDDRPGTHPPRIKDFIAAFHQGHGRPGGVSSSPMTMGHNLYSIAYQFYRTKFKLEKYSAKDPLLGFADSILTPKPPRSKSVFLKLHGLVGFRKPADLFKPSKPNSVRAMVEKEAREIITGDSKLRMLAVHGASRPWKMEKSLFRFVNKASERVLKNLGEKVLNKFSGADIFDLFSTMGSGASLYALMAPYFVAYTLFTKDRAFARACASRFGVRDNEAVERFKMAHFTDTFHEVNGVAKTIHHQVRTADTHHMEYEVITCGPDRDSRHNSDLVINFDPVGEYLIPEYPELTMYFPPFLSMLRRCFEQETTQIHAATPGPIGLAGLGIARILNLPITATYHTAFPQYAEELTGDAAMQEGMWRCMIWFYNQMDAVYVPSKATGRELLEHGIKEDKIHLYPRGIDIERFHPSKRNGFYKKLGDEKQTTFLYVGRVSKEKNLDILAEAYRRLAAERDDIRLAVVGDGPYLEEMKTKLASTPAIFTGYLSGDELAEAYASSDVLVFPSTTDTFGNVVLEAHASGIPAIVTDRGGPEENVEHGETGLIVPGKDAEAFRNAMRTMAEDPARTKEMGIASRISVNDRSFDEAFVRTWEMYRTHNRNAA